MKYIAVFCEESQTLTNLLRVAGVIAFSFDLKPCSGGHPEWHVQGDCLPYINGNCTFVTMDGVEHTIEGRWDMIVAHPTCTYLTSVGNAHFVLKKDMSNFQSVNERWIERYKAAGFFMKFINADCDHICVENPVGFMNSYYRPADQTIQPWWFGDMVMKRTCYWLKGLPKLERSVFKEPFDEDYFYYWTNKKGERRREPKWYRDAIKSSSYEASELRSKSFPMVAQAMVDQWALKLN